jgi:hypothetical protein
LHPVANPHAKLNCAGQGCPERAGCRRYELRLAERYEEVHGYKIPRFDWASFDLERAASGSCENRVRMYEAKRGAA